MRLLSNQNISSQSQILGRAQNHLKTMQTDLRYNTIIIIIISLRDMHTSIYGDNVMGFIPARQWLVGASTNILCTHISVQALQSLSQLARLKSIQITSQILYVIYVYQCPSSIIDTVTTYIPVPKCNCPFLGFTAGSLNPC